MHLDAIDHDAEVAIVVRTGAARGFQVLLTSFKSAASSVCCRCRKTGGMANEYACRPVPTVTWPSGLSFKST